MLIRFYRLKEDRLATWGDFERFIRYISPRKSPDFPETFGIFHNIPTASLEETAEAFRRHDLRRKAETRAKNVVYHEVQTFSPEDRGNLTLPMLEDLARRHIVERKAEDALVYSAVHFDKDHVHIHHAVSGVDLYAKPMRMDNALFRDVRVNTEKYQRLKYPHLKSVVYLDKPTLKKTLAEKMKSAATDRAEKFKRRTGEPTDKEKLTDLMQKCHEEAQSPEGFYEALEKRGLTVYARGKVRRYGILYNNRKWRFSTLGVDSEKMKKLQLRRERTLELKAAKLAAKRKPALTLTLKPHV